MNSFGNAVIGGNKTVTTLNSILLNLKCIVYQNFIHRFKSRCEGGVNWLCRFTADDCYIKVLGSVTSGRSSVPGFGSS